MLENFILKIDFIFKKKTNFVKIKNGNFPQTLASNFRTATLKYHFILTELFPHNTLQKVLLK